MLKLQTFVFRGTSPRYTLYILLIIRGLFQSIMLENTKTNALDCCVIMWHFVVLEEISKWRDGTFVKHIQPIWLCEPIHSPLFTPQLQISGSGNTMSGVTGRHHQVNHSLHLWDLLCFNEFHYPQLTLLTPNAQWTISQLMTRKIQHSVYHLSNIYLSLY